MQSRAAPHRRGMRAFAHPTGLFDIVKKDMRHAHASAGTIPRVSTRHSTQRQAAALMDERNAQRVK
jgi:hypothetical protein